MFVICFIQGRFAGGFGDRIVGLISVRLLSKLLNQPFYILWNRENVRPYIDYGQYDFERLGIPNEKIAIHSYVDNQTGLKDHLKNMPVSMMFDSSKANCFLLNQEIAQYLYQNKAFSEGESVRNYYTDILAEYKSLYTEILKPAPALIKKINKLVLLKDNIVGIQLRCGDVFMKTNKGETHNTGIAERIESILSKIKEMCDSIYNVGEYHVFLTSDYDDAYSKTVSVWGPENSSKIIYNADLIQHLDRRALTGDISKVFVDNYILSQNTKMLFITEESNYGRIAALSSIHDNIYDVDCNKLDLKKLFSKSENFSSI